MRSDVANRLWNEATSFGAELPVIEVGIERRATERRFHGLGRRSGGASVGVSGRKLAAAVQSRRSRRGTGEPKDLPERSGETPARNLGKRPADAKGSDDRDAGVYTRRLEAITRVILRRWPIAICRKAGERRAAGARRGGACGVNARDMQTVDRHVTASSQGA